ncbi:MAG TPA: DUF1648 domain-containing protein [Phycisphaeraceae bacterium]|nr:DUF1648 domain-containing protein [Phycisphaeraceae bacterium]
MKDSRYSGPLDMLENKPSKPPMSALDWFYELAAIAGVAAGIIIVAANYTSLPDRIPTHFNTAGKVNGTGPKETLFILPILSVFMYAMLTVLTRFPNLYNYPFRLREGERMYLYPIGRSMALLLKAETVWLFFTITQATVWVATQKTSTFNPLVMYLSLVVILVTMLFYIWLLFQAHKRYIPPTETTEADPDTGININ